MKTDTGKKIIEYVRQKQEARADDLIRQLNLSRVAIHKQLKKLTEQGNLRKIGRPPKVFYQLAAAVIPLASHNLNPKQAEIIDTNYLIITPSGEKMEGVKGFAYWCAKTNQPLSKTAKDYVSALAKYQRYRRHGLISGMSKLKHTFGHVYLDRLFYLDFYSLERFGKTKLGQLLLYAKQSQDKKLIGELVDGIKKQIKTVIADNKISSVGFIPPTVKRQVQLMKELEKKLHLNLRTIVLTKIKTSVVVPQKTLSKLADRIENARQTIIVEEKGRHNNILLIDDAVGSGATLNETAAQIRAKKLVKGKIVGLAITGSFKGFEVISEV
jgi:biotin operon repressor/hypoxanthine-guanine phosphoribosyltransferase